MKIPENRTAKENKLFASLRGIVKQLKCIADVLTTGPIATPTGDSCDNPTYVTVCAAPVDFEYKTIGNPLCYECPDGSTYQVVLCKKYEDGVEVSTETIVLDGTGIIPALPACAVPCTEEPCVPATESFKGDNATLAGFNEYTVFIPKCCEITITTSAGTIILPAQDCKWTYQDKFDCKVTDYTISGDCVEEVTTILTKIN